MRACERSSREKSDYEEMDLSNLGDIISKHKDHTGVLIPVLQEAQKEYGYLSEGIIEKIAGELKLPLSQVYGVVTFYSQFRLKPHGKHTIKVCMGTACHVSGAQEITGSIATKLGVETGGTTKDGKFTLEAVACLGCCGLAPVMMVDDETYGRLTSQKALKAVRQYKKKDKEEGD